MAANEAGISLMRKDLQRYIGGAAVVSLPRLLTPGFWLLTSSLAPNEAGISLMRKDLQRYVGDAALLAPGF
jgi:hypothetical protein